MVTRNQASLSLLLLLQIFLANGQLLVDNPGSSESIPYQVKPDVSLDEILADENDGISKGEYTAEENLGNAEMFEGDIHMDRSTKQIFNFGRDAVVNRVKHWRKGRVPYVYGRVNSRVRSAFALAIKAYNTYTCIRFVPRRRERDYIRIVSEGGCWSAIGKSGKMQKLSLGQGCEYKGTAIHEMMHAIGFFHEQSRLDRDRYISIQWGNIKSGMGYNFKKYKRGEADTLGAAYDYRSIMHYPKYAFSRNGKPTIQIVGQSRVTIGQRSTFSRIDLQQINKLYRCRTRPVGTCGDKNRECPGWISYCNNSRYRSYMRENCKKSCKLCGRVPCTNKRSGCSGWATSNYCSSRSKYVGYMRKYCRKSCRFC